MQRVIQVILLIGRRIKINGTCDVGNEGIQKEMLKFLSADPTEKHFLKRDKQSALLKDGGTLGSYEITI